MAGQQLSGEGTGVVTAPPLLRGFDSNWVGQMSLTAVANGPPCWAGTRPPNSFCSTANASICMHGKIKLASHLALLLNSALTTKSTNCWRFTLGSWPFLCKVGYFPLLWFF